ncbi:MAG: ImmA/IrrE family metallo-endopeptidase [Tepidisphaeraceae bacterium]
MTAQQRKAVAAARLARQELGAGLDAPLASILDVVEGPGGVPVTIAELPEGMAGALQLKRGRPFILVNGLDNPARQRFTLAHEFGHWRLGHGEVVDGQQTINGKTRDPDEVEANYFAGEFLVPEQAVMAWMQARDEPPVDLQLLVRFAVAFGVSGAVARIRLKAARYLSPKQNAALERAIKSGEHRQILRWLGLTELQDGIAEARGNLPRLPARLHENAVRGYQQGLLDVPRLARILRQDTNVTISELERRGISPLAQEDEEPDY